MLKKLLQHKENYNQEKIEFLSFTSFLLGFSGALLTYIVSSYFKEVLNTDNVGIFFLLSYVIFLIALLNLHKLINLWGKVKVFYIFFFIRTISLLFLIFLPPSPQALVFLVIYIITEVMGWVNLDTLLESFSADNMSGRIRGLHLTVMNTGILIAPFFATRVLEQFDYKGLFFAVFVVHFLVFSITLMGFRGINHTFHKKETVLALLKRAWQRKNIIRIYYISFILEFFYAIMIIFTPLYLLGLGFSWIQIGTIFSIMLVPFVLIQYPIGILADKETGEKELIALSLFIMGFSTLAFYYIKSTDIFILGAILFMTRVGASLIEILRDSYFYKRIDSRDIDLIDFFRTSKSLAYILAAGVSSILLLKLPIDFLFFFLAVVIFSGLYPTFKLKDNQSEKEIRIGKMKIKITKSF